MVPTEIDAASVLVTPNDDIPESVSAPVKKGDVLGTATVSYGYGDNRMVLGTVRLVADESVESSQLLVILDKAESVLGSKWIKIGLAVLAVLLVIYLAVSIAYNIKKTQKRANALSNITIPKYEKLSREIQDYLEEKEREEFTRQKVVKKNRMKNAGSGMMS